MEKPLALCCALLVPLAAATTACVDVDLLTASFSIGPHGGAPDVLGAAADDIWVGRGALRHWDGAKLASVTAPDDAQTFSNRVAASDGRLWVADAAPSLRSISPDGTVVDHSAELPAGADPLPHAWGDVVIVDLGAAVNEWRRLEGDAFVVMPAPPALPVNEVGIVAADDIYATTIEGAVSHFDGSAWSAVDGNAARLLPLRGAGGSAWTVRQAGNIGTPPSGYDVAVERTHLDWTIVELRAGKATDHVVPIPQAWLDGKPAYDGLNDIVVVGDRPAVVSRRNTFGERADVVVNRVANDDTLEADLHALTIDTDCVDAGCNFVSGDAVLADGALLIVKTVLDDKTGAGEDFVAAGVID